jgi:predicted metal-dependent hydrolase
VIGRPVAGASRRDDDASSPVPRAGTVLQGGRAKAYRPLPAEARRRAYDSALEAYDRGDFFETHELLEPAWMGTDDLAERALHQGLIKLAAAFVHGVRGNPSGIAKNLAGAREYLAAAVGSVPATASGLDLPALVAAIDDRLARLAADPTDASIEAPALPRLAR